MSEQAIEEGGGSAERRAYVCHVGDDLHLHLDVVLVKVDALNNDVEADLSLGWWRWWKGRRGRRRRLADGDLVEVDAVKLVFKVAQREDVPRGVAHQRLDVELDLRPGVAVDELAADLAV